MIAISYRREDSLPVAGRLYDRLQAKFGKKNVFMDFDSIPPGADFRRHIKQMIERSNLVIAIIGPHWLGEQPDASRRIDNPADFVRLEIGYALEAGIPVIPLLINTTQMPKPEMLPPDIQELAFRHALPLDSGMDFHSHADRLIAGIGKATDAARKRRHFVTDSEKPRPVSSTTHVPRTSSGSEESKRKLITWTGSKLVVSTSVAVLFAVAALAAWYVATHRREPASAESATTQITKPGLDFASITKEQPYENSLGMKFVPVAGTKVLFSIWDTRVQDYEAFVKHTARSRVKPQFQQTPTHPAVNISWEDSKAFCAWLTQTERSAGHMSDQQEYRLPTDEEWSIAVGESKYPWGNEWPPPREVGNYGSSLHIDHYAFTSPVGAFAPNAKGLYDMGGNVWQWCEDWYSKEMNEREVLDKYPDLKDDAGGRKQRVVRGASWFVGRCDIHVVFHSRQRRFS
jgi:Sulfatase-modifying factor enzyme 1/TIR domain